MKFLFQYSQHSIKYNYFIAEKLFEINPKYEFGIISKKKIIHGNENFLKSKKKLFNYFYPLSLDDFYKKNKINFDVLKNFEKDLSNESVWRSVASDRQIGGAFSHGSVGYTNKNSNDRDYILEYYSKLISSYEDIFNNFKPDFFVASIAMGDITVKIIESICKKKGIKYILPESLRINNYCSFSVSSQLKFERIENEFYKIIHEDKFVISAETRQLYQSLINKDESKNYFDNDSNNKALSEYISKNYVINFIYILFILFPIKILYDLFRNILFYLLRLVKINYDNYHPVNLINKIKHRYLLAVQKIIMGRHSYYDKHNFKEKFLYYPLMTQPEYSSNILSTMWMDQLNLIESVAKSLPYDWFIYVKEHPGILNERLRPKNYFKKIKKLPNVKLINTSLDSDDLIKNSQMVLVSSGTTGWQAILFNKPLLELRDNIWSILNLSTKCTDVEKIYASIQKEKNRHKNTSNENKVIQLLKYLQIIRKYGFELTYPDVFFYNRPGTEEENKVCGSEVANYMKKLYDL